MKYNPFCNTEIIFENRDKMLQRLSSLEVANVVLVMSESSALRWDMISFVNKLQYRCNSLNGRLIWIKNVPSNPTQMDVVKSLREVGDNNVELIIAFGGGSGIDLAKGISAFYDGERNLTYTKKRSYR